MILNKGKKKDKGYDLDKLLYLSITLQLHVLTHCVPYVPGLHGLHGSSLFDIDPGSHSII